MSFPYAEIVAGISVLLAVGLLLILRVKSLVWFVGGTAALWIPISLFLNAYSAQFKPPILKKWKERRTFFEWLYERDRIRAPKTNDEENKDSWVRVRLSQSSLYAKILLRPR